jgi:hypothetical protein
MMSTARETDITFEIAALWTSTTPSGGAPTLDHCLIRGTTLGWSVEGTIVGTRDGGQPFRAQYRLTTDKLWRTRMAGLTVWMGTDQRSVRLSRSDDGVWSVLTGEADLSTLDGVFDVDFALTPATNLLPVRRLGLAIGHSADMTAVWVRPDLAIEPLPQRYTRLDASRYRYESGAGYTFAAEIVVDGFGLVERYPDAWNLISRTAGA